MRPHEHKETISLPFNGEAKIIICSDLHLGAAHSRWDLFEKQVLERNHTNDKALFLFNGDMINCIAPGDPRYRHTEVHEMFKGKDNQFQQETHFYCDLIEKWGIPAGRILGHVSGNHEDAALKHHNYDAFLDIVKRTGSPYLGIENFVKINFRVNGGTKLPLVLYCHHGMGGGSRRKGSGAQLEKYINYTFPYRGARIFAFANEHALADDAVVVQRQNRRAGGLQLKEILYVNSGTYLGGEAYARRKMYSPKPIGHIEITVKHQRKRQGKKDFHALTLHAQKVSWSPIGVELEHDPPPLVGKLL
jgi:hypothetical protein